MKLKRVIAIMAVVLTLAASAPAAFAATDPGETTSQTVENQNSEENILIEFDLETGEEKEVIVEPEQDLDYYSPGTLGADIPPIIPELSEQGATAQPFATDDLIFANHLYNRAICHIAVTFSDGTTGNGTGFIVGKNTVVTAGHCIFDKE